MNEWINSVINSDQAGVIAFAAVFLLGVISIFTCACNFAVLGVVGGYTGTLSATGKTKKVVVSSVFFLLGTVIVLSAVGCLIGFTGEFVNAAMGDYGVTLAAAILGIGLGLGKISKILTKSAVVIKYVGGITLIVLGFYLLLTI